MKHIYYNFTACVVLLLLLSACKDENTRLYVEKSSLEIPNTGGNHTLRIESDGDWSIYNVPEWLSVSKFSGVNTQEIELTALPNYTRLDREHTISIRANDSKAVVTVKVKQFGYSGGSLFEVNDVKEKIFNGSSNIFEIEDSIVINSSVRWTITGPSWLDIRYNNVRSNMNGNLMEGSGTIYIFNKEPNTSFEPLHSIIRIQAESIDQTVEIPVTKLGADEAKCVDVLMLTDGIAFTTKYGCGVEYVYPGIVEGRMTTVDLDKVQWSPYFYPTGMIMGFDNLKPDTEYTICLLGMPDENQAFEKICLETFRTPSEINQPQANISNVRTRMNRWYCDIEMNSYAKGFYLFSYPLNYDVNKPELALHLKLNVLNTYMQTGFGYTTEGGTYYFPMFNGYIVSWPVGIDGKLSDMMDVRRITATGTKAPSKTKDNIEHREKRRVKKLSDLLLKEKLIR